MLSEKEMAEIFAAYNFNAEEYVGIRPITKGHINNTYCLYFDQGSRVKRCLLQEINLLVFKDPDALMKNIESITTFGKRKLKKFGVDGYKNRFLRLFYTSDHHYYIKTSENNCYRVYHFVEGAMTYQYCTDPEIFQSAGHAVGVFQNLLADFPAEKLYESIPHFHDTPYRYKTFERVLKDDAMGRAKDVQEEIDFVKFYKDKCGELMEKLSNGTLPLRVTHNDTKLNNVMINAETKEGLCLIDLDTVMPGTFVFDFGDAIRSGCNPVNEDEKDLSLVNFNFELFEAFTKGYIDAVSQTITKEEIDCLVSSAIIMTYEVAMRFLTDYLDGDHYFRVDYPEHNLVRARTQIHLTKQIVASKDRLEKIVQSTYIRAISNGN